MKPLLVLLSDLWGAKKSEWWPLNTDFLGSHYEPIWLDSCTLGGINTMPYTQEHLHQQFIHGGIDRAVTNLLQQSQQWPTSRTILAFSVGGVIAWKAIQAGLKVDRLYAISATRLRYEEVPLLMNGQLWYGSDDAFRPQSEWLAQQQLKTEILVGYGHDCYQDGMIAQDVAKQAIGDTML